MRIEKDAFFDVHIERCLREKAPRSPQVDAMALNIIGAEAVVLEVIDAEHVADSEGQPAATRRQTDAQTAGRRRRTAWRLVGRKHSSRNGSRRRRRGGAPSCGRGGARWAPSPRCLERAPKLLRRIRRPE